MEQPKFKSLQPSILLLTILHLPLLKMLVKHLFSQKSNVFAISLMTSGLQLLWHRCDKYDDEIKLKTQY